MATILGIDVGGTGIKAALVDTETGELLSERHRIRTPAESTPRNTPVDVAFEQATGLPFVVRNDADAAGIAEMQLGAGVGLGGMVIMITIGTGLGSGVFYNGQLIPNIELGRMPGKDGEPIEFYAGNRARKVSDLSWDEWGQRFNYFLERVARVFSPDHFIIGGGASKSFSEYESSIKVPTTMHVARFRNNAGIIGAAVAAEQTD
jgi:polyphosphate glucokinase